MLITRYVSLLLFVLLLAALLILAVTLMRRQQNKRKTGELPADEGVRELIASGHLDDAVELYSRFTGVDIYSALEVVQTMAHEMGISDEQSLSLLQDDAEETDTDRSRV